MMYNNLRRNFYDERKVLMRVVSMLLIMTMVFAIFQTPQQIHASNKQANIATFQNESIQVELKVDSSWYGAFNASVTVTNISNRIIDNWAIGFDMLYEVTSIHNAVVQSYEDGYYIIKNAKSNQDIEVGRSIAFSFIAKNEGNISLPSVFDLLCFEEIVPAEQVGVSFEVTSDWKHGYNGQIKITNLSKEVIEDWKLEFEFEHSINQFWVANIEKQDGDKYYIRNAGFNANINPGETISLGLSGSPGGVKANIKEVKVSQITSNQVKEIEEEEYDLFASKTEVMEGKEEGEIFFYLNVPNEKIEKIDLYENGTVVARFYDDGNFSLHGDDIKGDGIYSAKYTIGENIEGSNTNTYYAVVNQKIISNSVSIQIIAKFTQKELENIQYVDSKLSDVLGKNITPSELLEVPAEYLQNGSGFAKEYQDVLQKRYKDLVTMLDHLAEEGYIIGYYYDEINKVFNCNYSNGIAFGVVLDDILKATADELPVENIEHINALDYSSYSGIILNAFEDNNFRTRFYEELDNKWRSNGMNLEYYDVVTAELLKTCLSNKDIIVFSGHGIVYNGNPIFCLEDDIASEKRDELYSEDLVTGRVLRLYYADNLSRYSVKGDFFTHYYEPKSLDGSFIFFESCSFMGNQNENDLDFSFADAFIDCSAESVIGFLNSVMAVYSRDLMVCYFEELLDGKTAGDAFTVARNEYGWNDYEYRKPSFIEYLLDREAFEKMGDTAIPLLVGDKSSVIINDLRNGNFEIEGQKETINPLKWETAGDVRVLGRLGEIEAYESRMAFISTGIGSQSGIGMNGTQGSTLSQTAYNRDKIQLEFSYNFISEEPMEYVGSRYDDKFEIQILDTSNNVLYSEILESVNKSKWYPVLEIDFDGGDNTVFHTRWKTAKIDISSYKNQTLKIRFLVYDIGDSAYDSAILLDNVKWN